MPLVSGTIYSAATLTGNGNSSWFNALDALLALIYGDVAQSSDPVINADLRDYNGIKAASLKLVPADLATDETLDLDLNVAWDSSGNGDLKLHDFTQVTATNAEEFLILPGGESEAVLFNELGTNAGVLGAAVPPFWKLAWTLGGTTKSMTFTLYGTLEY